MWMNGNPMAKMDPFNMYTV